MDMKASPDELLTPSVAAQLMGIAVDTLRYHADRGHLPTLRTTNGRRLFRRGDVERFVSQRRAAA